MEELLADHARIGNVEYPLVRSKLRAWLALEEIYSKIIEAAGKGDREKFVSSLYSYLSAALFIPIETLQSSNWYDVAVAFRSVYKINTPSFDFPLLRKRPKVDKQEQTKNGWDYPGRDWFVWLHIVAKEYGWDINYIENLPVDEGIALLQEILINEQLDREFQWSMSQTAYPYDANTKTSKFVPLNRPDWMKVIPNENVQKVKIRASELPVGLVLKWNTDTNAYTKPQ